MPSTNKAKTMMGYLPDLIIVPSPSGFHEFSHFFLDRSTMSSSINLATMRESPSVIPKGIKRSIPSK